LAKLEFLLNEDICDCVLEKLDNTKGSKLR